MIRQMLVIDEDDIMSDIETQIIVHRFGISIEELNLSKEMSDACIEMARRIQGGEAISYEQLTSALTGIGEQYGCEYGVPLPSISPEKGTPRDVVMARGTPLRQIIAMNQCRTELECDLLRESGMGVLSVLSLLCWPSFEKDH